ncbi:MAG: hypothetical protein IJA10_02000 [Lachnospiraceae bacterium]|nr:hypothetical protein [Lachnospiraceae bacterium]
MEKLKMKKCYRKLVSFLLVTIMMIGSIPPISTKAATEDVKEALRQDMIDLIFDGSDKKVSIRKYNLKFDEYNEVWNYVYFNEPSIRIVRECYSQFLFTSDKDKEGYMDNLYLSFTEPNLAERYEKIQEVLNQIHSEMEGMKDIEKVLYAYDYVVQHTTYNLDATHRSVASGPLVDGEAVCGGYANAMLLIMELEGIECKSVSNSGHAWVAVKLDGDWYMADPTWGDTRSYGKAAGKTDFRFLLRNDNEFLSGDLNHTSIDDAPISSSTKYSNWYVHDIVGKMLYDNGYWYYLDNGSIVKNNIEGTAYEVVVEGSNLEIVSVENDVLTYKVNGVETKKQLNQTPSHTHTEVADKAVEATCKSEGKTEGSHCSVCNEVIVAQKTVAKKAHTEVADKAVEATCKSEGKTEGSHCSVCNEVIVAQKTVAKKEHTVVIDKPAVEATCKEEGKTAESHCSVCKEVLQKQETVAKKEHTVVIDKAVEPTTETEGKTEGSHCSVCNEVIKAQEVIPKVESGTTTTMGWVTKDGKTYYVKENGTNATGWLKLGEKYYYLDSDGAMQTGWLKYRGAWYYLNTDGVMATGWIKDGNNWYYLNSNGSMKTGWLKEGNTWYYLGSSGVMATGWVKDGGKWYYLSGSGAMQVGWIKVGGQWYYLGNLGGMVTGWFQQDNIWYYLNGSGAMLSGWQQIRGKWYYFYSSGKMATNTKIGSYFVNSNGEWVK